MWISKLGDSYARFSFLEAVTGKTGVDVSDIPEVRT